jgi:hypothetical protein
MRLYDLTEKDIESVINHGEKQDTTEGKLNYRGEVKERFKYPIKVICVEHGNTILVVSAYPLRKGRHQNESDIR